MEWNDFHKSWNPPCGDVPLAQLDPPGLIDKKFSPTSVYQFPWYLRFQCLWYGFKCWWKTGQWPIRVLYFSKEHGLDKELFPKVLAEVCKNPNAYINNSVWSRPKDLNMDADMDALFPEEVNASKN